jgi:hypothetical protein
MVALALAANARSDELRVPEETVLVAVELAANAVTHGSSRQEGGSFVVRPRCAPRLRTGRSRGPGRHLGRPSSPGWPAPTGSTSPRPSPHSATWHKRGSTSPPLNGPVPWAGHSPRDGRPDGLDIAQAIAALGHVAWAWLD